MIYCGMNYFSTYLKRFFGFAFIVLCIAAAYQLIVYLTLGNWTKSSEFGQSLGGVSAIFSGFAFVGLIVTIFIQRDLLENQKEDLALQREEIKETRKEFLLNKTTDIIYNQLERYENAVQNFKIKFDGKEYTGNSAFLLLDTIKQVVYYPFDDTRTKEQLLQERVDKTSFSMKVYFENEAEIINFSISAYNAVKVINEVLLRSNLPLEELNHLRNLFFRNIGFIQLGVLEDILLKVNECLDLFKEDNKILIEFGRLYKAKIFLESILKFRNTIFTDEIIKEIKENWTREFGAKA